MSQIIDLRPTMNGPFLRRVKKRKAEKRETAREIERETSELMKNALDGYRVNDVVYGADVVTGTHTGNPTLAQAQPVSASGLPILPVVIGIGVIAGVVLLVKK